MFRPTSTGLRTVVRISTLAAVVGLGGCQGGDDPGPPEPPAQLEISLSATSAPSGSRLIIKGIPDDVTGVHGIVTPVTAPAKAGAADSTGIAFILLVEGPDDELVVPLHPLTPHQGGRVRIELAGGDKIAANAVELELEPPVAAPGAFKDLVDSLQLLLDGWLAQLGTTRQVLRETDVLDLSYLEIATLFVHNVVDNPDNPNSLRAMADGDVPMFDGVEFDRDLLDAITAISKLQDLVDEKLAFIGQLEPLEPPLPRITLRAGRGGAHKIDCIEPPDFDIGPNNCDLLAEIMSYQADLELARASALGKYKDDLTSAALTAASLTGAAAVATGLGSTFWAIDSIEDGQRGMYPSQFISDLTDFAVDKIDFPEDYTAPGHWSGFKVAAVSEGWRFDDKIIEAFEQMIGAGSGLDPDGIGSLDALEASVAGSITDGPNAALKATLLDNNPGKLEYCPRTWVNIDCTGLPYSSGSSNSLRYDSDERTYEPVEVGAANLLVETMPVFGPGRSTGETKVINTEALEVFVDPFQATLDVTTQREFTARVAHAENQQVSWTVSGATMADTPTTATVTTPDLPWQTPILLTARSLANTGLREGMVDADPRTKTVPITYGGDVALAIAPPYGCIAPGETLQFRPLVNGLEEGQYTVIWNVVEGYGSIDQNGLYQSLSSGTSDAKISAEIEGVDDVIAYARVDVQNCACNYAIEITGPSSWMVEGADVALLVSRFDFLHIQWFFMFPDLGGEQQFTASLSGMEGRPAPTPGDTGTWRMSAAYFTGSQSWISGQTDEDSAVNLTVEEYTDEYMRGRITGTAVHRNTDGDVDSSVLVNVTFRAGLWDGSGGNWPCH